jgi:hypothetical protein
MKPLIVGRALALVRYPDGSADKPSSKHLGRGLNRNIFVKDQADGTA